MLMHKHMCWACCRQHADGGSEVLQREGGSEIYTISEAEGIVLVGPGCFGAPGRAAGDPREAPVEAQKRSKLSKVSSKVALRNDAIVSSKLAASALVGLLDE